MNLHESSNFAAAIESAIEPMDMRPEFIEKDYWVTFVLKRLFQSKFADQIIFKGGTALSKAHRCINRFSEDVDLALLPQSGLSESKTKKLLSEIDHEITQGLEYMSGIKRGRNRASNYQYPQLFPIANSHPLKSYIKIELNSFTNPVPHQSMEISSYLYQHFLRSGFHDIIQQYQMAPFQLNVLSLERTFFEKLMAVNRLSYDGTESLKGKLRHFYDLYQLYHNMHLKDTIFNISNFAILALVKKDDERLKTFHGEWLGKPLAQSPLFTSIEATWQKLAPKFHNEIKELTWGAQIFPSSAEIIEVLKMSKSFLEKFDQQEKSQAPVTLN